MRAAANALENAERWRANMGGLASPMTEARREKMLADWREWYAEGRFTLEALEAGVERVLRAFYEDHAA